MREFQRHQPIDRDDNALEGLAGPDCADLEERYGLGERRVNLDDASAVRGILVRKGKRWTVDLGLGTLHADTL